MFFSLKNSLFYYDFLVIYWENSAFISFNSWFSATKSCSCFKIGVLKLNFTSLILFQISVCIFDLEVPFLCLILFQICVCIFARSVWSGSLILFQISVCFLQDLFILEVPFRCLRVKYYSLIILQIGLNLRRIRPSFFDKAMETIK